MASRMLMPSDNLLPGVCDFHVHVGERIGGYRLRDGFKELDRIAKKYGISAIGAFVTEEERLTLTGKLRRMQEDARRHFSGYVHWHLTPVRASVDELEPLLREGCDLKFYTTYKQAGLFSSYEDIGRWMSELSGLKTRILVHCEDDRVVERASASHPFHKPIDHTLRRPELAEVLAVEKVLDLAVRHSHPVHIVHVSTPGAALLIAEARAEYAFITCETAPHYLLHNEDILKGKNAHRWLCSPPFRSEESRGLLVELLQDGVFDIIASDHCPFTLEDKDRHKATPEKVPMGIPGLETLYSSMHENFVETGKISLDTLDDLTKYRPRKLMEENTCQ
jgi:dihydropyrimidinase